VPHSKFKEEIVKILRDEGYLKDYRILKDRGRSLLKISMKYGDREKRVITGSSASAGRASGSTSATTRSRACRAASASRSSRRRTALLTDRQARAARVGGEVLCYIW